MNTNKSEKYCASLIGIKQSAEKATKAMRNFVKACSKINIDERSIPWENEEKSLSMSIKKLKEK